MPFRLATSVLLMAKQYKMYLTSSIQNVLKIDK
ncbi:hypothetical protein predicted by Glimmer/Critica [Salmonella enterica subsp. enterica serovar Weltevreden str. 2007-60-3289-1]|nr:hypothetical protein predicted by Glimmer/Critica [Salmonella enterica subsp. enterica serovar Weltevreden str. 2007-60-3289-1]